MKNLILNTVALSLISISLSITPSFASDKKEGNFARGAKAWAQTCNRCHNVRDPKEFSDSQWQQIMMHMRDRAGLTGQEERDILKFLEKSN